VYALSEDAIRVAPGDGHGDVVGPLAIHVSGPSCRLVCGMTRAGFAAGRWRLFVTPVTWSAPGGMLELLDGERVVARAALTTAVAAPAGWVECAGRSEGPAERESGSDVLAADAFSPALPDFDGTWPTLQVEHPRRDERLPCAVPGEPTGLALAADWVDGQLRLTLRAPAGSSLAAASDDLLLRWWIDGRPYLPDELLSKLDLMLAQECEVGERSVILDGFRLDQPEAGRRPEIEVQAASCPGGLRHPGGELVDEVMRERSGTEPQVVLVSPRIRVPARP
jgi:hypothetical protein